MISFLRPPFSRSQNGATVPTLSSALVTILGIRITRTQILRVSGLLALRSISRAVPIPLDDSVQTYLWSFLFSSAQAGVAFATAASLFQFDLWGTSNSGISGLFNRIFPIPRAVDGPFLQLYARMVAVCGPLLSCFETAVLVYETMSLTRRLEGAMYAAEAQGNAVFRPLLVSFALACVGIVSTLGYVCGTLVPDFVKIGVGPIAGTGVILVGWAIANDEANVVEAAVIALYAAGLWMVALMEEIALDAPLLPQLRGSVELKKWVSSDEIRAAVLVGTLGTLLVAMSRAERFVKLLAIGHDALAREEGGGDPGGDDESMYDSQQQLASANEIDDEDVDEDDEDDSEDDDDLDQDRRPRRRGRRSSVHTNNSRNTNADLKDSARRNFRRRPSAAGAVGSSQNSSSSSSGNGARALTSTATLLAATFRILIWAGHVSADEYIPIACRGWQVLLTAVLYVVYSQM